MQWFDTVDESRDGAIDVKELQRALQLGNLHFSLQAVAQMIRCAALGAVTSARSPPFGLILFLRDVAFAQELSHGALEQQLAH